MTFLRLNNRILSWHHYFLLLSPRNLHGFIDN
uniref:Uncharacterized protein n=1 Tax=Rhizophora mucronata TaxID=61149 RepID=A0A2P2PEF0_RHIMU